MSGAHDIKPAVHICETNANASHLSEICAGLEEEGIPYVVFKASGGAKLLAFEAANHSHLRVGIGITPELAVLQIRNCPFDTTAGAYDNEMQAGNNTQERNPIFHVKLSSPTANSQCRALGTNAARAVKGGTLV